MLAQSLAQRRCSIKYVLDTQKKERGSERAAFIHSITDNLQSCASLDGLNLRGCISTHRTCRLPAHTPSTPHCSPSRPCPGAHSLRRHRWASPWCVPKLSPFLPAPLGLPRQQGLTFIFGTPFSCSIQHQRKGTSPDPLRANCWWGKPCIDIN